MKDVKRETLYSAPAETDEWSCEKLARRYMLGDGVEKNLDEALRLFSMSSSSLARYASASIYNELQQYDRAERELSAGLETEDDDAWNYIYLELGRMYLRGHCSSGKPDYDKAVQYLEKGLRLEPTMGARYAGDLGAAYEQMGKRIQALHWYREAVEAFGLTQYREALNRLYLTGIAGAAKKKQAEAERNL